MKSIIDTFKINNGVEIPCMGLGTWQADNPTTRIAVFLQANTIQTEHCKCPCIERGF